MLLATLASNLTAEFCKEFDEGNLRHMRSFYLSFPKCDALRHELSWTHYRAVRVETAAGPETRSKTGKCYCHMPMCCR